MTKKAHKNKKPAPPGTPARVTRLAKNVTPPLSSPPRAVPRIHTISGIVLNYEGQSDLTFVRSPDVSVRGMFVNTARHFPQGAILNVCFRLALSGVAVQARSEVRYCLPGVGVGLEFIGLDSATRRSIEREVALNAPIPHKRRRPRSAGHS